MPMFRKKPVVVEAHQLPSAGEDATEELMDFVQHIGGGFASEGGFEIHTLEGTMTASPGDWIIKGVQGEFYPCKPDIFAQTYEPAKKSWGI